MLSDFAASQITTLRTDIDQLCSLVPHKNSAALWEMGCYMIQSITDRFLIEDTLLTSVWKELTDFCTSCAGGVSDANFSHAVYQSVFAFWERADNYAGYDARHKMAKSILTSTSVKVSPCPKWLITAT